MADELDNPAETKEEKESELLGTVLIEFQARAIDDDRLVTEQESR